MLVKKRGDADFVEVPTPVGESAGFMGMGVIEMAAALRNGRSPAATGSRALHLLEVLVAIQKSGERGGAFIDIAVPGEDPSRGRPSRGDA